MNANLSREAEPVQDSGPLARELLREAPRYFVAAALALVVDACLYIALIRLLGFDYLVAAPLGYTVGIVTIYLLCTRWVFRSRRLASVRSEFLIFSLIGVGGLVVNQLIVFVCVEKFSSTYELAKLTSAAIVFGFNFSIRKLMLFTRFEAAR